MKDDDDFDKLVQNAMIYGTAVMLMSMDEKMRISTRVIPIEEYTELGEHLKWIAQNTKAPNDS
jgi:hypothetical protein